MRDRITSEILASLNRESEGRLILSPRFGKTRVGIKIAQKFQHKRILWVTPLRQLAEVDIPEEFEKWGAKGLLKGLETTTWRSLHKYQGHYDLIILDEEQHITYNNSRNLVEGKLTWDSLITLTGTKTENFDKIRVLEGYLRLPIIKNFSIEEAVDEGVISDYNINVVYIPVDNVLKYPRFNGKFYTSEWDNYKYWNNRYERAVEQGLGNLKFLVIKRLRNIYDSPTKHKAAKSLVNLLEGRKLIFCPTQKLTKELSKYNYHGNTSDKNLNMFLQGKIDELAVVTKGGTGVTYTDVTHTILIQSDSDTNGSTTQKIARSLLKQDDYEANIWILCLKETQDEVWVESTLKNFHPEKINKIEFENLETFIKEKYDNKSENNRKIKS